MTTRRDVVFVHIPKTAGTSLRGLLEKSVGRQLILRDYGGDPATTPQLFELVHVQRKVTEFRRHFSKKNNGILLSGHFPAARYWEFFNAESFVTFLRNPVDRVISEYAHFVNFKGWTGSFEEFVERPASRNIMANFLAGVDLDRFGFIGFMEDFETGLDALSEYIGARLPMKKENVGRYRSIDPAILTGEKYRSMILDLNRQDIALYDRLRQTRKDRPRAIGAEPAIDKEFRGGVQLMPKGIAIGWLRNAAREFIAEVEVLRDGRVVSLIRADLYRERAKLSGGSRSGVCGFRLNLRDLPPSGVTAATPEKISFRAAGSDYELKGSPILFQPGEHAPRVV